MIAQPHEVGHLGSDPSRLTVKGLRITLGRSSTVVVDEVSFSVARGEVLGLVGESGSGKTTVALALLGYARRGVRVAGGEVRLDGTDLLTLRASALLAMRGTQVAYVPQDPASALNPGLRVGIQLRETLIAHPGATVTRSEADRRVAEVLEEVHLDAELLGRYPHQLSGGQQQRVAIAMAFICRPDLIVLDEPTTGLDVTTERRLIDTIRQMCGAYGVAGVYVSHDLAVVWQLATQVAVMYSGRIVELGPAEQVLRRPAHPYTRGLLRALPSATWPESLEGIEGRPPRLRHRPEGCSFAPRCPWAVPACRSAAPPPIWFDKGAHFSRCIRANEVHGSPVDSRRKLQRESFAEADVTPALKVSGLSAYYGSIKVLVDLAIEVNAQECVAVVGESGSGKTTLARCIVGLQTNWVGDVCFGAERLRPGVRGRSGDALRGIQYVFQNPYASLNPRKTVGQLIDQPLDHFFELSGRERDRRVVAALDDVSLGADYLMSYPDQLSGGERQRVAIARALAVAPTLLVCDEVTSSLDVSVQAAIVELLRRLQQEKGLAMLFITHNLALVRSIAQSIVVLHNGHIVERGAAREVLDAPQDPYTARLLEDVTVLTALPGSRSRDHPVPRAETIT